MRKWGKEIREARERSGHTQEELARKTGLSRNTIVNYETGRRIPRADDLMRIAEACGVASPFTLTPVHGAGVEETGE